MECDTQRGVTEIAWTGCVNLEIPDVHWVLRHTVSIWTGCFYYPSKYPSNVFPVLERVFYMLDGLDG